MLVDNIELEGRTADSRLAGRNDDKSPSGDRKLVVSNTDMVPVPSSRATTKTPFGRRKENDDAARVQGGGLQESAGTSSASAAVDAVVVTSADECIGNALTAKLYLLLTGERAGRESGRTFLSLVKGGIPFSEKALSWLADGQRDNQSRVRARNFANIANTIPNSVGSWNASGAQLGAVYEAWMSAAKYPPIALEAKYTDALVQAKKLIATSYKQYTRYRNDYQRALIEYNARRALNPNDETLPILKKSYEHSLVAWEEIGHRKAVERALVAKCSLESSGWATAFRDLRVAYDNAKNEHTYLPVEVVPEDFMTNDTEWSTMRFSSSEIKRFRDSNAKSWGGSVGVAKGLFEFRGSGTSAESFVRCGGDGESGGGGDISDEISIDMTVEFQYCRTALVRAWFDMNAMFSRCWWYEGATQESPTVGGVTLSDGKSPTAGKIPMIPTEAVWIRNLKVHFGNGMRGRGGGGGGGSIMKQVRKQLRASESASFWLFSTHVDHSRTASTALEKMVKTTDASIEFPGTCLAAFVCRITDKCPDPLPAFLPLHRNHLLQLQADTDSTNNVVVAVHASQKRDMKNAANVIHQAATSIATQLTAAAPNLATIHKNYHKIQATYWLLSTSTNTSKKENRQTKKVVMAKAVDRAKNVAQLVSDNHPEFLSIAGMQAARKELYSSKHATCFDKHLLDHQVLESAKIAINENMNNVSRQTADFSGGNGEKQAMTIAMFTSKKWHSSRKVLNCMFLDGLPSMMVRVMQHASTWTQYTNIKLIFYRASTTQAASGIPVVPPHVVPEIRISFQHEGNWSLVGTDCLLGDYVNQVTMNFATLRKETTKETVVRRAVLHEFGHVFGAVHEHQSPKGKIPWDTQKVIDFYRVTQGWSTERVQHNLFDKYSISSCNASEYDRHSIMHYPIFPALLKPGYEKFAIPPNNDLSEIDKRFMRNIYGVSAANDVTDVVAKDGSNSMLVNVHKHVNMT